MRKIFAVSLTALIAVLVLALPGAPARLLPLLLDADRVALSGVSGTLWNGQAARAVVQSTAGPVHLGELRWQLRPMSVLLGSPALLLSMDWGSQRGTLRARLRGNRIELRDVDFTLEANVAKQFLPVSLDGRLELLFKELHVSENLQDLVADGRAVWRNAGWLAFDGRRPLGTYAATFSPLGAGDAADAEPSGVAVEVATLAGDVEAQGSGRVQQKRYELELSISADAMDRQLEQALALIATPVENGYLLRLDGVLNN
ncbi:MAG: type II secretion system protein N [Congregibacter sp.]